VCMVEAGLYHLMAVASPPKNADKVFYVFRDYLSWSATQGWTSATDIDRIFSDGSKSNELVNLQSMSSRTLQAVGGEDIYNDIIADDFGLPLLKIPGHIISLCILPEDIYMLRWIAVKLQTEYDATGDKEKTKSTKLNHETTKLFLDYCRYKARNSTFNGSRVDLKRGVQTLSLPKPVKDFILEIFKNNPSSSIDEITLMDAYNMMTILAFTFLIARYEMSLS